MLSEKFEGTPTLSELGLGLEKDKTSPEPSQVLVVQETPLIEPPKDDTVRKVGVLKGRIIWKSLRSIGVKERSIPAAISNKVVRTSRKGEIGQIKIRRHSGVESNGASRTLQKFEREKTQGRDDIIEKFQAAHSQGLLTKEQERILDWMVKKPNNGLPSIVAAAKADPVAVLDAYVKGCALLGKMETLIEMHQGLPAIARKLVKGVLDGTDICPMCAGAGMTAAHPTNGVKLTKVCIKCDGSGRLLLSEKHKEFAIQKVLEVTKMVEREPLVQVSQQNLQISGASGGFMEQMARMSDKILYEKKAQVIEAEVVNEDVQSQDYSQ